MNKLCHVIVFIRIILFHALRHPMWFIRIILYVLQSVGFYMICLLLCSCSVAVTGLETLVPVF
jgi:hypothetical protein